MSLISEISSLFPFSPQIHRQAWMDICWKWHWNSRNQQFCTGIDLSPLTHVCNICLCVPALVLALWTVTGFYCSNYICYTLSAIFGLGSITLFLKWMLIQHSDKFLIASGWAYGELNLMRNLMVQQNLKTCFITSVLIGLRSSWLCEEDITHLLGQVFLEHEYSAVPLAKEQLWIEVQRGIFLTLG